MHYQYYIRTLGLNYHKLEANSPHQKVWRRFHGAILRTLEDTLTPQGYQYHKQILPGQTQLVEFKDLVGAK